MFVPFFVTLFFYLFILTNPVNAHCPLCVAGAGFGVSLSRILGIDDSITGIWLGTLLGAMSFYLSSITLRKLRFPFKKIIIYLLIFLSTLWSFYQFNLIDVHAGLVLGLEKLTFGMILGALSFYLIDQLNIFITKRNNGPLIPYQRMVISFTGILLISLFDYILLNYFI